MIKILHLYYDLLNLYGENGNIIALKNTLELNNIPYEISFKTINESYNINDYDITYLGSGTETNLLICLEDIIKHQEEFKTYIENNKLLICTGNSNILFGKSYQTLDKKIHHTLNIFEYESIETSFRTVGEQVYETNLIKENIIGFLNHQVSLNNYDSNLFKVITGNGYKPNTNLEGLHYKNFYGTLLIGPFLIRNPYMTNYILKNYLPNYKEHISPTSIKAYETYLSNFINN